MEPIQVFFVTLAVVSGIISPFLVWLVLSAIVGEIKLARERLAYQREEAHKRGPYQEVKLKQCPNMTMVTVEMIKEDEVVFSEGADLPYWLNRIE